MADSNVSRRNVLKWSGALAAAGIVGIGLGFGADLLVRPNATKTSTVTQSGSTTTVTQPGSTTTVTQGGSTATETVTTTVTAPPTTLSYVPPLSPQVQSKVDSFFQSRIALHQNETISYAAPVEWPPDGSFTFNAGPMKVRSKGGIITAVEPDDTINKGIAIEDGSLSWDAIMQQQVQGRVEPRLYAYPAFLYHPQRLLYPMKRVGGAHGYPGGSFVRTTWDDALTTVVSWMNQTKAKYGNYSINNNSNLGPYFGCDAEGWGCDSSEVRGFAYRFVYGTGYGIGCGYTDVSEMTDMFNSKLILLFGVNNFSQDLFGYFGYYMRLAREKGIPVISIDPRYTETGEALADQWIPIRMATDTALALAMANVMFKQNLYDTDYVSKFVEPTGFQKWKDYVLGNTAGPDGAIDRTPEWAAPITGIPAATITALAQLYAQSKPTYLICGNAISNKQPYGENPARIFCYLQAMAGYTGIAGGTETNAIFNNVVYGIPLPAPDLGVTPGSFYNPVSPEGPGIYQSWRFPDVILQRPKFDSGQLTETQYDNLIMNKPGNPVPNIHMTFDYGLGTASEQRPQVNYGYEAYSKLDYIVSVSANASDPVAQVADIILPVAVWTEKDPAFFQNGNRFIYQARLSTPQGQAKSLNWIHQQLANRLGFGTQFSSKLAAVPFNDSWPDAPWDAAYEATNQAAYEAWTQNATVKSLNPPSWSDFKNNPTFTFPVGPLAHPPLTAFAAEIQQGKPFPNDPYRTSGKIEFYSNWLATTDMSTTWYGGPILAMAEWNPPWANTYWTMAEIKKYPLLVTTAHPQHRVHNWTDANPLTGDVTNNLRDPTHTGDMYQARVYMNPIDASNRGIEDGDQVNIFNDAGTVRVTAMIVPWITPGTIHLPEGRWGNFINGVDVRGNANTLTYADRLDPSGSFPHVTIAEVVRV